MTPEVWAPRPKVAVVAWCLVVVAALLEVVWALALTEAEGLRHLGWAGGGIAVALISLVMLTMAMRELPLGSAYAVWVGLGAVGVVVAGVLVLDESLSLLEAACLVLIVAGAIGLPLTDTPRPSGGHDRPGDATRDADAASPAERST